MIKVFARGNGAAEVEIYAPIGENWYGDGLTAKRFRDDLKALGDVSQIVVRINSPGGEVFDGFSIYNALKEHAATVTVYIDGLAASIASVIAMAGDEIYMGEGAMFMVHSPWTFAMGDADDMRATAEMLDKIEVGLVDAYVTRTGQDRKTVEGWMDGETWFTRDEAIDARLADGKSVESDDETEAAARWSASKAAASQMFRAFAQARVSTAPRATAGSRMSAPADANSTKESSMPNADQALAAETSRRSTIRARFGRFADEHRALLDACLDDVRCTPDQAGEKLLAKLAEGVEPLHPGHHVATGGRDDFCVAASDALAIRAGCRLIKPHPGARDLASTSVIDIARTCLSRAGRGRSSVPTGPASTINAAMSTSDFPYLLGDTVAKVLRGGYENEPASHRAWVKVNPNIADFKTQSRIGLGSGPDLKMIPELGEYTYGSLVEARETFVVSKFGRALALSWEALVNDDLQAFAQLPRMFAQAARRKEADTVYTDLLLANSGGGQTMADTKNLFHADHGNLESTAAAFGSAQLNLGRVKLRKQTALGGGLMNINPRILLVPVEKETAAEELISATSRLIATTTDASTPKWISSLQLAVEPRLPSTAVYLIGASDQIDTCELGILADQHGAPYVEEEPEFERDAMHWKVRHVFGARFIDYRGIVKIAVT